MNRLLEYLSPGQEASPGDDERFRWMLRTAALVGLVLAILSEMAHYLTPRFPQDVVGTGIMAACFAGLALAAHLRTPRLWLGVVSMLSFAALGWWVARATGESGGIYSIHRDAIYGVLAGAHALLLFSAFEFTLVTLMFVGAFVVTGLLRGDGALADYGITLFYVFAFYCLALVGNVTRTRLRRSERRARAELEALNQNLQREVTAQVERIRRAEELGRYLPPELSERVLAGERGPELAHGRRSIAVLSATPFGFLESLTGLDPDDAAPLVNAFVSELTRVAFTHRGVIERFIGPRVTVLFGALEREDVEEATRRAVAMARDVQEACSALLREWEAEGYETVKLRMAIGITAGTAVVGTFGSERRVEYTALGEAVVRAHRLAIMAIPGEVRLDQAAAELIGGTPALVTGEEVEFTPGIPEPTHVVAGEAAIEVEPERDSTSAALGATMQQSNDPSSEALASTVAGTGDESVDTRAPVLADGALFDGRYHILERVGRGGMATVYRARHASLDQLRAIKLLHPARLSAPGAVEQFRRETEATSRIHHPNVVRLHDFGRSLEGLYYLALDFVDGQSLAGVLRNGRLPGERALEIAGDILWALQAAHELRLVHRDLKPANVLIDGQGRVRVTDFGMVQPLHGGIDPHGDVIVGTPAYMSPEQCQGLPLDGRSDLYSFGVTLYQMLTGVLPYRDLSSEAMVNAPLEQEPVPIEERLPDVPAPLRQVLHDCLRRDPTGRPRSALEVRKRLWSVYTAAVERRV